ncbi:MAG: leucine-rich repeat protein [Roseburia sp.]|nr:leucine-rich repeat protein [Roseburia sp.]
MKKKLISLLISFVAMAVVSVVVFFVSKSFKTNGNNSHNNSVQNQNEFTVVFDANGGKFEKGDVEIDNDVTLDDGSVVSSDGKKMTFKIDNGALLAPPLKIPERSGYVFDGWYSDAQCENEYTFDYEPLKACKTLYAKWSITFNYTLSADKSYYTVTGIGGLSGDVEVPETYNLLPVSEIADNAFYKCSRLTGIVIADSVTKIGDGAFSECTNLVSVKLGNGVTKIGNKAFDGGYTRCGLEEINIPASVEYIGKDAFQGCYNLQKIKYEGTAEDWCAIEFAENTADTSAVLGNGKVVLYIDEKPATSLTVNTENISDRAFKCYDALTSVTFGAKVKTVGKHAFFSCTGLKTLDISAATSLSLLDEKAFCNTSVKSLSLPASDVYVGKEAFASSDNLTSLDLGGAKIIGDGAFEGTSTIQSLNLGVVEKLGDGAMSFSGYSSGVTIPSTLWLIGKRNFAKAQQINFETADAWYANFKQDVIFDNSLSSSDRVVELSAETLSNGANAAKLFSNSVSNFDRGYYECTWVKKAGELQYKVSGSEATVTGANTTTVGGVYVPNKYNKSNVTAIASGALNSSNIKAVSIGDNVSNVSNSAELRVFAVSPSNQNFTRTDGILYDIKNNAIAYVPSNISGHITILSGVTSIDGAFSGCSGLTSITIPNSVTSIGAGAFRNCSGLTSITIPDSVTDIGCGAFEGCSNLTSITLPFIGAKKDETKYTHFSYIFGAFASDYNSEYVPKSLKAVTLTGGEISAYAFYGCRSLTSVTIPDSLTSIGDNAFYECTGLTSITVGENNTVYASQDGILYNKAKTEFVHIPDNIQGAITIPDSVTSIGDDAFRNCNSLTSITIGNGVTSIGWDAFSGCSGLTSITIPDSVTRIGFGAFSNCSKLTSVKLGNGVTSIGDSAFSKCSSLISITIPDGVTSIGHYAFEDCSSLKSVIIPNSVTDIGSNNHHAFIGCNVKAAYYKGTENDLRNNPLYRFTHFYYFSETKPTDSGNFWHYGSDGVTPVIWTKGN